MKTMYATACAAVVAVTAVFLSGEFGTESHVYADALRQIKTARTLTYTNHIYSTWRLEPVRTKEYVAEDGRIRSEHESGSVTIFDPSPRIRLKLLEITKTALVFPAAAENQVLKQSRRDWIESLAKLCDKPDKELGEKMLDGRQVVGFEASQANHKFTLWLDAASKQLVRIELDYSRFGVTKSVMTDFHFDEPLEEALFSYEVPEGYQVYGQPKVTRIEKLENHVIEALREYTQVTTGKFPKGITHWGEWAVLLSRRIGNSNREETQRLMRIQRVITALIDSLPQTDYEYLGDGKTTEEKDAIVFWYKNKEGVYRAVYGDLSVKTIEKDQLPGSSK